MAPPAAAQIDEMQEQLLAKINKLGELPLIILDRYTDTANSSFVRWVLNNGDEIIEMGERFARAVKEVWDKLAEVMKGYHAPGFFVQTSDAWLDVANAANNVGSDVQPAALKVDTYWQGVAADAYTKAVAPQSAAAARLGAIANATRSAMSSLGWSGVLFYAGITVALASTIVEISLEISAAGTGVGAIPAAIAGILTAAKILAILASAVGLINAVIANQMQAIQNLRAELGNDTGFPGGNWPVSTSGKFADATVTDGDADWSVTVP